MTSTSLGTITALFTLFSLAGCNDGCRYCEARLEITVDGLPTGERVALEICDGDSCVDGSVGDSECAEVPRFEWEGAFEVCNSGGQLYALRRQFLVSSQLPVDNPPVSITVTNELGDVLADFEGIPTITLFEESCVQPCEWRAISF